MCKREEHNATICDGSGGTVNPPTNQSHTNPTDKIASTIINNDSQQKPIDAITSSRPDAGPLREFVSLIYYVVI